MQNNYKPVQFEVDKILKYYGGQTKVAKDEIHKLMKPRGDINSTKIDSINQFIGSRARKLGFKGKPESNNKEKKLLYNLGKVPEIGKAPRSALEQITGAIFETRCTTPKGIVFIVVED